MRTFLRHIAAVAVATVFATGGFAQLGTGLFRTERPAHPTAEEMRAMSEQYAKLSEFYRIMAGNYLDTMNYAAVVEKGITSMLAQLDPHSTYLTAKEQQASNEELGGGFSGIGIEFNTLNDTIIVVNTILGGPAERVGMLPNDRIVGIDGKRAVGMTRTEVPRYLRGKKGTKVEVEVFRRGTEGTLDFTIVRDDIPINTIDAAYKPDPRTGYIKVNRFGATTGREFGEALDKLGAVEGLILDLRGNGGGFLPEAIRMSEVFLDSGQRIVSTEGNMYPPQEFDARGDGRFNRGRLIVLVDEISASASEIVAGAVQDWDRGLIVGNPTFGKGLVQREFPLEDGSAVRLTIARYLTPTGRAIQRPYERGHTEDYYRAAVERYNAEHYGGTATDSIGADPVERFQTLRSGRPVFGAGGIRPDVIIPADTTGYSQYWARLVRSGTLPEFVQTHIDSNRDRLKARYGDIENFVADFDAAELVPALVDYAAARGVERDESGLETSRGWIASQLKALIAQRLWDVEGYYRVSHTTVDDVFRRAHSMMLRWYTFPWGDGAPITEELITDLAK
jgi:carboxyl-terminal processing protease